MADLPLIGGNAPDISKANFENRIGGSNHTPSAIVTFAANADYFSGLERRKRPHTGRISGSLHSPVCPLTASAPVLFGIGGLFSVRGSAGPVAPD